MTRFKAELDKNRVNVKASIVSTSPPVAGINKNDILVDGPARYYGLPART